MHTCSSCTQDYQDKFEFCPHCGTPKRNPKTLNIQVNVSSKDRWETCKIYCREWKNWLSKSLSIAYDETISVGEFWANGVGPEGKYTVGESPIYRRDVRGDANLAHTFLINQLARDGWEATNISSGSWWEMTLRRKISKKNARPWQLWFVYPVLNGRNLYFTLAHSPDDATKPLRGKRYINYVTTEKSAEVKVPLFGGKNEDKDKEYLGVRDKYLKQMIKQGFNLPEQTAVDEIKGMQVPFLTINPKNSNWQYQVRLKRI